MTDRAALVLLFLLMCVGMVGCSSTFEVVEHDGTTHIVDGSQVHKEKDGSITITRMGAASPVANFTNVKSVRPL